MELKKFQIQFERSIGNFSEVFNYLNVLEELGMYVDFKINYKSSSFWVNVNLYNSLEDIFPFLSFEAKILPISDDVLKFIQTTNMLKAYLFFSLDGDILTVCVYDEISTDSQVSYEAADIESHFAIMSFYIFIQEKYKNIIEYLIPLLTKYSEDCFFEQKYKNIISIVFRKSNCELRIMLPTNESKAVKIYISKFNSLQSMMKNPQVKFSLVTQKKCMFLKVELFAHNKEEQEIALSRIRYL